jgi:hypothetical protein
MISAFALVEAMCGRRAHAEIGDRRAAKAAIERAFALAEPERLIVSFVITGGASSKRCRGMRPHPRASAACLAG